MTIAIPYSAKNYSSTREFDEKTAPQKLLEEHRTKPGVWGLLCVIEGAIRYIDDQDDVEPQTVTADQNCVIRPDHPHHVELIGPVRFRVDFYR